jgi:RecA-family ATPase
MSDANYLTIYSAADLLDAAPPRKPPILDPILVPGTLALIYGPPGVGKSFFAMDLALAAAGGGTMLGWSAPRPHRVLYLDGEMRRESVADRLRLFGPPPPSLHMWLATEHDGEILDLAAPKGIVQLISSWGDTELVIIDSLSSLAGITGGDPERWSEMRRFLVFQQKMGRAVVVVHHANRDGGLRGIGRRTDAMDIVMALRRPRDWQPADGARFELHMEMYRHRALAATLPIKASLCHRADGRSQLQ